ncbi:MAG: MBL fold metallo-hydrolase [Candidatus Woesebacteria bacterium]
MKIKFLGASGTVTGSSYVLTSGSGQSVLIDLGMFQGIPAIEKLNYDPFEYDCSTLSAAILTHAHLDHCGRLPILLSHGFAGDIWMTRPTQDLTELSLLDSAKIAKQDDKVILYDKDLAEQTFSRFKTTDYRVPVQIGEFTVTFRDAGHIMGSASLEIEDAHPNSGIRKIVFSGDLGNSPEDLLEPTEMVESSDAVVMESTYGDRLHPEGVPADIIMSEIKAIETAGGTLLIPAFSLERTQELLHTIMHLKKEGKVKLETPIVMDSPMASKATDIYENYPENFNAHIKNDMLSGDPFSFMGLQMIMDRRGSEAVEGETRPQVIIAGSGMMSGGRILGHAAHYLPIPSTRLLIVGYQGEGTHGRELLEGKKEITIDGEVVSVRATINSTQVMSSHADQGQLLEWLSHIKQVKKVFLTHGEDGPRSALAEKIKAQLHLEDITMPILHQEVEF